MDMVQAEKALNKGAWAAFIRSGLILTLSILSVLPINSGLTAGTPGLWGLVDVVLIAFCGIGLRKKWWVAGVAICTYEFFFLFATLANGQIVGQMFSVVFLTYFGKALHGAFVVAKMNRGNFTSEIRKDRKSLFLGIPLIVIVFLFSGTNMLVDIGAVSLPLLHTEGMIPKHTRQWLTSQGIAEKEEEIKFFYPSSFRPRRKGVLITDKTVAHYEMDNGKFQVQKVSIENIAGLIALEQPDNPHNMSLKVILKSGDRIDISMAKDSDDKTPYVDYLKDAIDPI